MKTLAALGFAIAAITLPSAAADQAYDKAAVHDASAALRQAQADCKARVAAKEIQSNSELAACSLAAEHIFFTAIKLKKMDVFEAYADSYQALAADRDAGISKWQADRRGGEILRKFYADCNCRPQRPWGPVGGGAVSGPGNDYQGNGGFVSSTGLPATGNPFPSVQ